jgi:heparanase
MKRILLLLGSLILVLVVVIVLGMWDASGNFLDLISGQFEPEPKTLKRDISQSGGQSRPPYNVQVTIDLSRPVSTVDPEYLSFAIDLSQVVGGKWWSPQATGSEMGSGTVHAPIFDFDRPRLDALTRALAPAYLRIGGSESDKVYYDLSGNNAPPVPPGYQSVLTTPEWDAVNSFARRNGLKLVFTLNAGPAARMSDGSWNAANAAELMRYTAQRGYSIADWELGNELNIFWFVHGLRQQVPLDQYKKDLQAARNLAHQITPAAHFSGQGSAFWPVLGEPLSLLFGYMPGYLAQAADLTDMVSWHYYPQQSRRGPIASRRAFASRLLDPSNLDEAGFWADRIRAWRDQYAPGKSIWLGETGNARFGGEPGLSDVYLGGLWWNDELGLLARHGQSVVVRQTLSGMNYGMIDENSLDPKPDYWNSLLWKRLMGTRVYSAQATGDSSGKLRVYPQSTMGRDSEAVTVLAINLDPERAAAVSLPQFVNRSYEVYEITAPDIFGTTVLLNGSELRLGDGGTLPIILGATRPPTESPVETLHPLSYTFFVFPIR